MHAVVGKNAGSRLGRRIVWRQFEWCPDSSMEVGRKRASAIGQRDAARTIAVARSRSTGFVAMPSTFVAEPTMAPSPMERI